MRYPEVPHKCLERLADWRHMFRIHGWDKDTNISDFFRESTVPAHYAQNPGSHCPCELQRSNQIRADLLVEVSTSNGQHKHAIYRLQATHQKPAFKNARPSFIVRAGR